MRRPPGSGHVYQPRYRGRDKQARKARSWWMQWTDAQGERHREPTKATSRPEAEKVLRARLLDRDLGKRGEPVLTTLEELVAMVVNDYKANGRKSTGRVEECAKHLEDFFGAKERAPLIDEARVTAYVAARLEAKARPATVNRELAVLRRGFRLAARSGRVERRPDFSLLAENNARKGFVEREQLEAIVAKLPAELQPPVRVAYLTGWRMFSELLTRQWRHVDLKAGWLRLDPGETKSGDGRMFPLTEELRDVLEAQETRTKTLQAELGEIIPWVFHRGGRQIRGLRRAWLTACTKAGLPGRLVHDLRRSAVRNLERAGVPRSAAMAMVGHKTQSIYSRYAIVDEGMLREAAKKIEAKG